MEQERHLQIRRRVVEVLNEHGYFNTRENYFYRNPKPEGRNARFDVVILDEEDDNKIICVIEVKKERKQRIRKMRPLKQLLRYQKLVNCPVVLIRGLSNAELAASKASKALNG